MPSTVCMTLTSSSSGTWLNGSLQPQHYYVSLTIEDPNNKIVARVALTYEQAARMLLYNGDVECTLESYRNEKGELVEEKVAPPKTVHQRMKERLGDVQQELLKRVEDIRRDLDAIVNGDAKPNKTKIAELLKEVEIVKSHMGVNESFVVQQAEEELGSMQNNAAGQLGVFLQTKLGVETPAADVLKQLLPISNGPLLIGEKVEPVTSDYQLKKRDQKPVDKMTAKQVAEEMSMRLKAIAATQDKTSDGSSQLYLPYAVTPAQFMRKVRVTYISYQDSTLLTLEEAQDYLIFLQGVKSIKDFKKHFNYKD